jgi:hypothetical protein
MIRTNTQQQVIEFLRAHPGSTITQMGKEFNKSRDVICSALDALESKHMCQRISIIKRSWTYKLTPEADNFKVEALKEKPRGVLKSLEFFAQPAPRVGPATSNAYTYSPYVPGPWESVRPGADDHKQYASLNGR